MTAALSKRWRVVYVAGLTTHEEFLTFKKRVGEMTVRRYWLGRARPEIIEPY